MTTKNVGNVSDGYHTFNELYQHRNLLFIALLKHNSNTAWYSHRHADLSTYEGYFICGFETPLGMVTYHMSDALLPLIESLDIVKYDTAPKWDGHTSEDVLTRIEDYIQS